MNSKKLCASAICGVMLVGAMASMAACAPKEQGNDNPPEQGSEPKTIVYQLEGEYTDDTLKGYGFDYFYLLNLYSDNTITYSGYNQLGMDSSSYAENSAFYEKWGKGSWEIGEDVEGEECINIKLICDEDAVNLNGGGTQIIGTFLYSVYENSQGNITFTIDVPFASGRESSITGGKTIKYENYDQFIEAHLYKESLPESSLALLEDKDKNYRLYCLEDGTAQLYSGRIDAGTDTYKYISSQSGRWNYSEGQLKFNFGGADVVATVEGTKATLNYSYNMGTAGVELALVCEDASAILQEGSGGEIEQPVATFTYTSDATKTGMKVYEDGTAVFVGIFGNTTDFTWVRTGNTLTFTEVKEDSPAVIEATIEGDGTCTFTHDPVYGEVHLGGEMTCANASTIPQTALVTFDGGEEEIGTVSFYADGTATFSVNVMKINFTWVYDGGKLTVTPVNPDDGAAFEVTIAEDNSATFTYTKSLMGGAYNMGGTFVCEDISALIAE